MKDTIPWPYEEYNRKTDQYRISSHEAMFAILSIVILYSCNIKIVDLSCFQIASKYYFLLNSIKCIRKYLIMILSRKF
jgi:hypothetical protein